MKGTDIQRCIATLQAVMRVRGLYDGDIDGVWGPKCVSALKEWERDASFDPALPTRGMMFQPTNRLPKGLMWKPGRGLSILFAGLPSAESVEVQRLLDSEYVPLTADMINAGLNVEAPNIPLPLKVEAPVAVNVDPKVSTEAKPATLQMQVKK